MEWMLQVADELDDAFGMLRHGWLGLVAEIGALILAAAGIGAELAGQALGAQPSILAAAAIAANVAALLMIRSSRAAKRA
ncbi:MAG TPA: hypothetical protein VME42_10275 [Steroidobacteraceae bacterium]|nr:hypothetical protein [Steroidobacteraceae bacterium]